MSPKEPVNNLINCMTNDEDLRQELWVHYLSGNPVESFANYLEKIKSEYSDDIKLRVSIWSLIQNPPSTGMEIFLNNFTDYEKSILCLVMLGLSLEEISRIKGINQVRIRQTISTIRYNGVWSLYGGTKDM